MDKLNVEAWVGRGTLTIGSVSESQARQISATLDQGEAPREGEDLPPLWHWCAFANAVDTASLGRDGHARGTELLPPVQLARRMWASGSLSFHHPLRVGETIERRSRVYSVVEKASASGPMVFVTLSHQIWNSEGLAIEEMQDIVYLDIPEVFLPPAKRPMHPVIVDKKQMHEALLFRYSALTFNAHRIHYDLPYTQQVEKYPNLVVHGPLQATLLMNAATKFKGRKPISFDFRGLHPMFSGQSCDIAMAENEDGLELWTGQNGHQCMRAHAVWEQTK